MHLTTNMCIYFSKLSFHWGEGWEKVDKLVIFPDISNNTFSFKK